MTLHGAQKLTGNQKSNIKRVLKLRFKKSKVFHHASAVASKNVREAVQADLRKAGIENAEEIEALTSEATSILLSETVRMRNAFTADVKKAFNLMLRKNTAGMSSCCCLFCSVLVWSNL
jgi:fructose/tagatose bisphosphate aldolase